MNDREFLEIARDLETATDALLTQLANDFDKRIAQNAADPSAAQDAVAFLLSAFAVKLAGLITDSVTKVAALQASRGRRDMIPRLMRVGAFQEATAMSELLNGYSDQIRRRFPYTPNAADNITFERRVSTIRDGSIKTVRNIITNATNAGMGAKDVSRLIQQYVVPTPNQEKGKPYNEYRKRFGRPNSARPRGVHAGTIQYNAIRLARTEVSLMYDRATYDFYDGKKYIQGYDWLLSNRHPAVDICDANAKGAPYKTRDDVPEKHPQCPCRVLAIPSTDEQLRELVAQGVIR